MIGAPSAPPNDHDLVGTQLGWIEFVYVVAPEHPLASAREPLNSDVVTGYRVAVVSDTSRSLSPMTTGVFAQSTGVSECRTWRPRDWCSSEGLASVPCQGHLARADINAGRLVHKVLAGDPYYEPFWMGWRADSSGKALEWLRHRLVNVKADWITEQRIGARARDAPKQRCQ